jgi:hypothetical protein
MNIIRKYNLKNISAALFLLALFVVFSCGQNKSQGEKAKTTSQLSTDIKESEIKYKVTFIELGSVRSRVTDCHLKQMLKKDYPDLACAN